MPDVTRLDTSAVSHLVFSQLSRLFSKPLWHSLSSPPLPSPPPSHTTISAVVIALTGLWCRSPSNNFTVTWTVYNDVRDPTLGGRDESGASPR